MTQEDKIELVSICAAINRGLTPELCRRLGALVGKCPEDFGLANSDSERFFASRTKATRTPTAADDLEPWKAAGVSRATWFRQQKAKSC